VLTRRPVRLALILAAVAAFLAISFELARFLNTESDERGQVYSLLKAQARGSAPGMLALLDGCRADPRCRAQVTANARALRRPGTVKILAYDSATAYSLRSKTGQTRVAWTVINHGLPVVQCVTVRRTGSVLAGRSVTLLRLSAPIAREGSC
jgi:hypothetical protein